MCKAHSVPYLGAVDANSPELVDRAALTDLVVIGGYDGILKKPFLDAPRYGVINTHLGLLPLNRGCCPSLWAQLHGLSQGYTTYLVGEAVDHGPILDLYEAPSLGGLLHTNRHVYDALAEAAVRRFGEALWRLGEGHALKRCEGLEAYHKKGMPNDGWLSFHWSHEFILRFSLALDFAPYLPGRARLQDGSDPWRDRMAQATLAGVGQEIYLAVTQIWADESIATTDPAAVPPRPGTVLELREEE
ncbi:Methionyl-tRNA formyltransferase, partial [Durusdinium trenchii]